MEEVVGSNPTRSTRFALQVNQPPPQFANPAKVICWLHSGMRFGSIHHWKFWGAALLAATASAQTPSSSASPTTAAPVPYASVSELNLLLSDLQQASQATQADLTRLRIEKWKTDSNTKHGTSADVDSIQRNLQNAMPELVNQLKSSPENLTATFKLYRNLDALCDVFGSVVESAGAFGPRDDFQALQNDLDALQRSRRAVADRMENLSTSKESEVARLRTQVQTLQAAQATPPPAPKKTVVDDNGPPAKKPVKKKRPAPKPASPAPGSTTQPANSTPQQPPATPPQQPQP